MIIKKTFLSTVAINTFFAFLLAPLTASASSTTTYTTCNSGWEHMVTETTITNSAGQTVTTTSNYRTGLQCGAFEYQGGI